MNKHFRLATMSALCVLLLASCDKGVYDPATDPNKQQPTPVATEYTVDKYGYATYEYGGFQYKFKKTVIETDAAKAAMTRLKSDIDIINNLLPEAALKVMKKKPIWLEENNKNNSSAAWYHSWYGYPASIGDIAEKGNCVEITNYNYYVSWAKQNQPFMVLHELCHLYHGQGLGGDTNATINNAYNNAQTKGLYKTYRYRSSTADKVGRTYKEDLTVDPPVRCYCMNTAWEYFAEMCEAYWGENDYYPFNYEQLKEHDPVAFQMCETIFGKRADKQ